MKKYLGSMIGVYCGFAAVFLIVLGIVGGIFALSVGITVHTVILAVLFFSCTIIWFYYLWTVRNQFFSFGVFNEQSVRVSVLFSPHFELEYKQCVGCGIGYYIHGILNTNIGSKVFFIYLSLDPFDERYRTQINLWKPSDARIKVQFSEKLYQYLMNNLPGKQAAMLQQDYNQFMINSKERSQNGRRR